MILKIFELLAVLLCLPNSISWCSNVEELNATGYDIFLDLDYENLMFEGKVWIGFENFKNDINKIKLHSRGLNITSIGVKLFDLVPLLVTKEMDEEHEHLIIEIPHLLPGNHSITVKYGGRINNISSTGLFKQTCHSEKDVSWIGGARLEPVYARSVFPSLELSELMTPVKITLAMKQGYKLISSQPSIPTSTKEGRQQIILNFPHVHISKIGWVVYPSDGSIQTSTIGNQAFFTCRKHREWLDGIEKVSGEMVKYTGLNMTNLQWVLIPDSMTPISSCNNIVFIGEHLMDNSNFSSLSNFYENLMSMAEGISGQLFGSIDNSKPWSELWLIKGLNKFLTYKLAGMTGVLMSEEYIVGNVMPRVLQREVLPHSFSNQFDSTQDILSSYNQDLFDKAGLVLRMLEDVIGEENFKEALNKFLNRATSATNGYDLTQYFWESLISGNEEKLPFLLKSITLTDSGAMLDDSSKAFSEWIRSPGYPVVSVSRHADHIHISQQSVLKNAKGDYGYWWIPVSITSQTLRSPKKYWLRPKDRLKVTIPKTDTWYLVNENAKGLYRVNYDLENWRNLSTAISNNELEAIAKAKLIDDALGLAEQHILSYRIGLSLTRHLSAEVTPEMWEAVLKHLITIRDILDISPANRNAWDEYVASLIKQFIFGNNSTLYNWTMGNSDELNELDSAKLYKLHLTQQLCRVNPHCSSIFSRIQPALQENNTLYGDLLDGILCYTMEVNDNSTLWDIFFQSYLQYRSASFERKILRGLACTNNSTTLTRFINMFFDKPQTMRLQDLTDIIPNIAYSEKATLEFIVNNRNIKFMSYAEVPEMLSEIVTLISEKIYSEEGFAAVRRMLNLMEQSGSYRSSANKHEIHRAFERIKLNRRRRQSLSEISDWILGKDDPSLDYLSSATLPNVWPHVLFISPLIFILSYMNSV